MQGVKGKIYTIAMLAALLGFVFGGWFLTRKLLDKKEEEFLSGTGTVALSLEQTALLAQEEAEQEANAFKRQEIPEALMGEILALWDYGVKEMPHEPKARQMSMEQAIEEGKRWISLLASYEIVPNTLADGDFDRITAQLSTPETASELDERLLGRWSLEYRKADVDINLTIHAMSGEIWYASISMMASSSTAYEYSLETLLDIMFQRAKSGHTEVVDEYNGHITKVLEDGIVQANLYYFRTFGTGGQVLPSYEISFWLDWVQEYDGSG